MTLRILLHSMTYQRDFPVMYVLSRLLEHRGAEVIVCNNTSYTSRTLRAWRPDGVLYVTLGQRRKYDFRGLYPHSRLFFFKGEAGKVPPDDLSIYEEYQAVNRPEVFHAIDRIYTWNSQIVDDLVKHVTANPIADTHGSAEQIVRQKFFPVGGAHNDLARFAPPRERRNSALRIGFIGRFQGINNRNPQRNDAFHWLLSAGSKMDQVDWDGYFGQLDHEVRYLRLVREVVRRSQEKNWEISIRPYNLERLEAYRETDFFDRGLIEIDQSLSFCNWLKSLDIVVGPISTTVPSIAMTRTPYIAVDRLCPGGVSAPETIGNLSAHVPESIDQMLQMLDSPEKYVIDNAKTNRELARNFDFDKEQSTLLRLADDMIGVIREKAPPTMRMRRLPTALAHASRRVKDKSLEIRFPERLAQDYSYFNAAVAYGRARRELDPVANEILKHAEAAKRAEKAA